MGWVALTVVASAEVTPLPKWDEVAQAAVTKGELVPGAALLEPEAGLAEATLEPPDDEVALEDAGLVPLPEAFWETYFGGKPETFLLDPQGLLGPNILEEREDFLAYHASDSKIDFHVFLFGGDQGIPGEVRVEELGERLFAEGKPALLAFYYLGRPERAELVLSPGLKDAVTDTDRRRVLQSAIQSAQSKSDPVGQFEAFCVQISIRIYWMEKTAGLEGSGAEGEAAAPMPVVVPLAAGPGRLGPMGDFFRNWGLILGGGVAALLVVAALVAFVRWRARFRFPEFDVQPRLGGAHGAGIGAVVRFGSTTQGPARQRDEIPDALGGI